MRGLDLIAKTNLTNLVFCYFGLVLVLVFGFGSG
jgi:hypothetical protein